MVMQVLWECRQLDYINCVILATFTETSDSLIPKGDSELYMDPLSCMQSDTHELYHPLSHSGQDDRSLWESQYTTMTNTAVNNMVRNGEKECNLHEHCRI